jgi:hypothetical protein
MRGGLQVAGKPENQRHQQHETEDAGPLLLVAACQLLSSESFRGSEQELLRKLPVGDVVDVVFVPFCLPLD